MHRTASGWGRRRRRAPLTFKDSVRSQGAHKAERELARPAQLAAVLRRVPVGRGPAVPKRARQPLP